MSLLVIGSPSGEIQHDVFVSYSPALFGQFATQVTQFDLFEYHSVVVKVQCVHLSPSDFAVRLVCSHHVLNL